MTQRTDFKGQLSRYLYDINNRLTLVSFEGGLSETYSYDAIGNRTQSTKTENGSTSRWNHSYDELNRISPTEAAASTTQVTRYTFDTLNRLKTVQDPDANITTYQ